MIKERYKIEILDKVTKEKTVYLTNNFTQNFRFHMIPVKPYVGMVAKMIDGGYESVNISIPFPKVQVILPLKKKRKVRKTKKKRKIRKH